MTMINYQLSLWIVQRETVILESEHSSHGAGYLKSMFKILVGIYVFPPIFGI
jgi:hypothetical protein